MYIFTRFIRSCVYINILRLCVYICLLHLMLEFPSLFSFFSRVPIFCCFCSSFLCTLRVYFVKGEHVVVNNRGAFFPPRFRTPCMYECVPSFSLSSGFALKVEIEIELVSWITFLNTHTYPPIAAKDAEERGNNERREKKTKQITWESITIPKNTYQM